MPTEVDHLPPAKQRELERVVQILFEEFEEATALATQEWKKKGRILKIILYGSYARGGWVDEPHTAKGYQSDFDLLIIVSDKRLVDRVQYWAKAEERLIRELAITKTLRTLRRSRRRASVPGSSPQRQQWISRFTWAAICPRRRRWSHGREAHSRSKALQSIFTASPERRTRMTMAFGSCDPSGWRTFLIW